MGMTVAPEQDEALQPVLPEDPGEQVSRPDELTEAILLKLGPQQSRMVTVAPKESPGSTAPRVEEKVSRDTESYFDPNRYTGALPQSIMR